MSHVSARLGRVRDRAPTLVNARYSQREYAGVSAFGARLFAFGKYAAHVALKTSLPVQRFGHGIGMLRIVCRARSFIAL